MLKDAEYFRHACPWRTMFFYVDICQCQEARSAPKDEALINEMLPVVRYFCGAEIHFTKHHNEDDRG